MKNFRLTRRTLLKSLGLSALTMAPAIGQAAILSKSLPGGLSIEVADADVSKVNGGLVRVSIINHTAKAIELRELASGAITIDKHRYNLNTRLSKAPISVGPQGIYQLWLHPEQTGNTASFANFTSAGSLAELPVTILWGKPGQHLNRHTQMAHAVLA